MNWLNIAVKVVQLVWTIIGIWKTGGSKVAKEFVAQKHAEACDVKCQLKSKKK